MQAIIESLFDVIYLTTVVTLGIIMIRKSKGNQQFLLFGIMAVVLGLGDAFHLVPRMIALNTTGLEDYTVSLGIGKFITSITMTLFYIILYYVWRKRYNVVGKGALTLSIYVLAATRIIISLFPQNGWTSADSPLSWAIYRNIPFALMGILIIYLFYKRTVAHKDSAFKFMSLTIILSFAFYIPVVLWGDVVPMIGMLMIPKTCAYVWTIWIGYSDMKKTKEIRS
ncbi:MAG TPA: hypothetical protein VLS94_03595 [Fusibacter sp.]|nr:hypothetical protein [Fusibacter sp.]